MSKNIAKKAAKNVITFSPKYRIGEKLFFTDLDEENYYLHGELRIVPVIITGIAYQQYRDSCGVVYHGSFTYLPDKRLNKAMLEDELHTIDELKIKLEKIINHLAKVSK